MKLTTSPLVGVYIRWSNAKTELFPEPDGPTIATDSPGRTLKWHLIFKHPEYCNRNVQTIHDNLEEGKKNVNSDVNLTFHEAQPICECAAAIVSMETNDIWMQ